MSQILYYSPGQVATVIMETLDSTGVRADGITNPIVERIILPGLLTEPNYPKSMSKIDVGLYDFSFTLPTGAAAVGSYIVDILYADPTTSLILPTFFQIIVTSPFGIYNAG